MPDSGRQTGMVAAGMETVRSTPSTLFLAPVQCNQCKSQQTCYSIAHHSITTVWFRREAWKHIHGSKR
jgi:hypothetical protein